MPGLRYFASLGLAGAVSCSLTHSLVVPLDVIKTRLQMDPALGGPLAAAAAIAREGGSGLACVPRFLNGVGATAVGYLFQGAAKFGGYELGKMTVFNALAGCGERGERFAESFRLPIMLGCAASAELFASAVLCPLEVLKLRMQTEAAFAARGLGGALLATLRQDGVGALFKGFVPIALRQVGLPPARVRPRRRGDRAPPRLSRSPRPISHCLPPRAPSAGAIHSDETRLVRAGVHLPLHLPRQEERIHREHRRRATGRRVVRRLGVYSHRRRAPVWRERGRARRIRLAALRPALDPALRLLLADGPLRMRHHRQPGGAAALPRLPRTGRLLRARPEAGDDLAHDGLPVLRLRRAEEAAQLC